MSQNTGKFHLPRAELCAHTKFGPMNSCADVYSLFEVAKERGITAIAITDTHSVRAYPYAEFAAEKFGVKLIYGCELLMTDGEGSFRVLAYVQTQKGLTNLCRLLSAATDNRSIAVTREEVERFREGLLIAGSDEILNAALRGDGIRKIAEFYDAIPVTVSDLALWPELAYMGDDIEKPVFFVGDARYTDQGDKIAYDILTNRITDKSEKHHLKTSSDLIKECEAFFCEGELDLARRLISDNTTLFASRFTEQIRISADCCRTESDNVSPENEPERLYRLNAPSVDASAAYSMIHKWQKTYAIRLTQEEGKTAMRALIGIVRAE